MEDRYIRRSEVARVSGISVSTIRRLEIAGEFPLRRQLGPGSVAWLESEILSWMESRAQVTLGQVNGGAK